MTKIQIKPYLDVRRLGSTLRFGNVPPNGIEILDAPDFLSGLVALLSHPTKRSDAIDYLVTTAGLNLETSEGLLEQLTEADVVGSPITGIGRYSRHLLYYDMIGLNQETSQQILSTATVGIVGTGGIGSNVAMALTAAGVGHLILTDGDRIELSNLTRQFLFSEINIGQVKVEVAAERLRQLNSTVKITPVSTAASRELFEEQLRDCDLVVLSADTPDELHEWIDEAARKYGFGYIAAGYMESFGSVGPLVLPGVTACYECFRADGELEQYLLPGEEPGPNLNQGMQAGSYGPLNQMVAAMAANEVLRCLLGAECRSAGTRLLLDSQSYRLHSEHFPRRPDCPSCTNVHPNSDWLMAVQQTQLEDLYESDRSDSSLNSVVLDALVEKCANVRPGMTALDFGCGTGEQVLMLAERGAKVVAFDSSTKMLTLLRSKLPDRLASQVQIVETEDLPPYLAEFDLVLCNNVLDHIADLGPILANLRQAVRHDGTVVITVPHPVKDGAIWNRKNVRGSWEYEDIRLEQYFEEGPITKHREDTRGNVALNDITTHHRTIETYFTFFRNAGFQIAELYEPQPDVNAAADHPELWAKASRIPYFLVFVLHPENIEVSK